MSGVATCQPDSDVAKARYLVCCGWHAGCCSTVCYLVGTLPTCVRSPETVVHQGC